MPQNCTCAARLTLDVGQHYAATTREESRGAKLQVRQDMNATQAAIRAGYSPKTANEQATRLLANVSVQAAIAERMRV